MRDGGQGSFFTFHQVGDVEIPELGTPPLPPPPAHRTAPRTSAEAGEGLIPVIAGIRQEVLDAVRRLGSATPHEVAEATGYHIVTVRARMTELQQAGFLWRTEECRLTPSGHQSHVYRIMP